MKAWQRAAAALGVIEQRAESETPAGVMPPARDAAAVNPSTALSISSVFRAVQIHQIAASQLSIDVDRRDQTIPVPSLIRQPDQEMSRSAWIGKNIVSLATTGNAFWRIKRARRSDRITDLPVLNPHEVAILEDRKGRTYYSHKGTIYSRDEIQHLALLRVPGKREGLGPIQAARAELAGIVDLRDYASSWFNASGVPSGVLKTEQVLSPDQAERYQVKWTSTPAGQVRVLGHGLNYQPVLLNPADAQWLENQKFSVTQVARLMGVPASLMLAAVEGTSQTYANVEQDWIGYVRFSLMGYLREIEEALSVTLPRGQDARFSIETLLRTDTKTRYEAHKVGIDAGFLTVDEVRDIEHLGPMPDQPAPAPAASEEIQP